MRLIWPKNRTWIVVVAVVAVLLITVRAVLPIVVKRYVNKTLAGLKGYSGQVEDVDLSLWRGAYQIDGLRIVKSGGKVPVPFLSVNEIDLSVEWKALLDGRIVAEIELFRPKLNFVNAKSPQQSQTKVDESWTDTVRKLVPFDINRFAIYDGQVHYRDFESKPRIDVFVQNLDATAYNLTNSESFHKTLYARLEGHALAMGSGKIDFRGKLDPYAKHPTFAFVFKLNGLEIKQLNPFLQAYADVDAEKGTLSVDSEFEADHGKFRGYVKPFIEGLQVLDWEKEKENFFHKLWEGVVEVAGNLLENPSHDRVATRIPLEGSFDDPAAGVWPAIGGLLKNAFIVALRRGLEDSAGLSKTSQLERKGR